ncbi:MAG: hypothetical protein JW776_14770, partial [Candidatus Lokiarchaeota archaeon]|nr:hypothetical protein [Candidatus Lokiarchaeota archaeon]
MEKINMTLAKILRGKNTCKRKKKTLVRKSFFIILFFVLFFGLIFGIQSSPTTLNSFKIEDDFSHDFPSIFPKASIGPTIENLTKTDPLEYGNYANISVDINHTDNGVDTVLIDIGGINYTMTWGSGNEYNYTWQPNAVGNIPFTIYANASTIGDLSSLADSITVQDTIAPSLSGLNEASGDPTELGTDVDIRITITDLSTIDTV